MNQVTTMAGLTREQLAERVALDIPDGAYANVGIGIPELITRYIPAGREVIFHTENGLLGMGPAPSEGLGDPELINAGKQQVTAVPGAAYFHHADSFSMIRGGHIDITILGALQVAKNGDLANWSTGRADAIPAVGGAMDLVAGVGSVWVVTDHCRKDGTPKLVESCAYPLTGAGVVDRVYTNLGVVSVGVDGFTATELAEGVDFDEMQASTDARLVDGTGIQAAK